MRKRKRLGTCLDILYSIKAYGEDGAKPTRVMSDSNMSWQPLNRILKSLMDADYVKVIEPSKRIDKRTKDLYKLTQKGEWSIVHYNPDKDTSLLEMVEKNDDIFPMFELTDLIKYSGVKRRSTLEHWMDMMNVINDLYEDFEVMIKEEDGIEIVTGAKPTRIMYQTNVDWNVLQQLLKGPINLGYVKEWEPKHNYTNKRTKYIYELTLQGERLLGRWNTAKMRYERQKECAASPARAF